MHGLSLSSLVGKRDRFKSLLLKAEKYLGKPLDKTFQAEASCKSKLQTRLHVRWGTGLHDRSVRLDDTMPPWMPGCL